MIDFQISDENVGRLRGHGLLVGLFPSWFDVEEQASPEMAVGGLQGPRSAIQEEPQVTVSSPPDQLHQGCLELLQAHHQVRGVRAVFS